jgi:hypothetical protein
MTWYKTGTVAVTAGSNAVIGTGTSFIANSRVGDAFRGPDGEWYEVSNIASDTALSIAPTYQGPTLSGGIYSVAPMQGYVKASADALRAAVNQYGEKLALLGTTGNYDILPKEKGGTGSATPDSDFLAEGATNKFFTVARVREVALAGLSLLTGAAVVATDSILVAIGKLQKQITDLATSVSGKAAKGANGDITSLAGLTTSLSVSQGGTGRASISTFLSDLLGAGAYAKSNILGAVSQTSGIPTGAVIERGTNASGEYIKFADGTMICTGVGVLQTTSAAIGSSGMFFSPANPYATFPISFVGTLPRVTYSAIEQTAAFSWVANDAGASLSSCTSRLISTAATATAKVTYIAIGRWF